jgi:transcriptional regulator with XRE-family HTH domain
MNNTPFDEICLDYSKSLTKEKLRIVGINIKRLRKENRLTQADVAFHIHSDKSLISSLERGITKNIEYLSLIRISIFFNIDVESLTVEL